MDNNLRNKFIADINVTPFVDVMLVLLVIFMVTAPFLTQGIKVNVPHTKTVHTLPQDKKNIVISVTRDKKIFIDKYEVKLQDLSGYLKKILSGKNNPMVFLKADKTIAYGFIVKVMGEIKDAGVEKLGIVAEMEKQTQAK